jgi:hypothetical protein
MIVICRRSPASNAAADLEAAASVIEPLLVKRAPQFAQNLEPAELL